VTPFWAVWPFETLFVEQTAFCIDGGLAGREAELFGGHFAANYDFAIDNLFETSFPYSMGFHQRPTDGQAYPEWHFHAHYFRPFCDQPRYRIHGGLRTVANPQRDITAEKRCAEAERDFRSTLSGSSVEKILACYKGSVRTMLKQSVVVGLFFFLADGRRKLRKLAGRKKDAADWYAKQPCWLAATIFRRTRSTNWKLWQGGFVRSQAHRPGIGLGRRQSA